MLLDRKSYRSRYVADRDFRRGKICDSKGSGPQDLDYLVDAVLAAQLESGGQGVCS